MQSPENSDGKTKVPMNENTEDVSSKASNHLEIQVVSQNGASIYFKLNQTTPFQKMFDAYVSRFRISKTTVRFLYNGVRLNDKDTPKMLDMEDGDIIDVVLQQTGGYLFKLTIPI